MDEHITIIISSITLLVDLSRLTTGILKMIPLFNIVFLAFTVDYLDLLYSYSLVRLWAEIFTPVYVC